MKWGLMYRYNHDTGELVETSAGAFPIETGHERASCIVSDGKESRLFTGFVWYYVEVDEDDL